MANICIAGLNYQAGYATDCNISLLEHLHFAVNELERNDPLDSRCSQTLLVGLDDWSSLIRPTISALPISDSYNN